MTSPDRFSFQPGAHGTPHPIVSYPQEGEAACPITLVPATGQEVIVLRRGEAVKKALSDSAFSRANVDQSYAFTGTSFMNPLGMLRLDPPDIRRIHTALGHLFFSEDTEIWTPGITAIAQRLAQGMDTISQPTDLNTRFIEPFIAEVATLTLGLPKEEWVKINDFTNRTLALIETEADIPPIQQAWEELHAYTQDLIEQKQQHPDGSMISDAIHTLEKAGMTGDPLLYAVTTILNAYPTPLPVMSVVAVELLQRPEIVALCQEKPELWAVAIDEAMRYKAHFAIVQPRIATKDTVLDGQTIHQGEVVLPSLTAAAHDPEQFSNPDTFDILQQTNRRNIVFGAGPHYCLGAEITRQWLSIGLQTLFTASPNLHLADDPSKLQWGKGILSTPAEIPVVTT